MNIFFTYNTPTRWISIVTFFMMFQLTAGCQAKEPRSQKQSSDKPAVAAAVQPQKQPQKKNDSLKTVATANEKLIVYYFHGNMRCPTCYKLESYAKSVVENDFSSAIKNGKLEWKTVNVEDKGNEHFANDYKLYTKSVIVSTQKDGKESSWKNLDQIWTLVGDQTKYMEYIHNEVKACLDGKCL